MNKEEILAKSRAENKGTDEREKLVLIKAGQIAFTVGGVMCMLIALFNSILSIVDQGGTRFDPKLNTMLWSIYLSMLGSPTTRRATTAATRSASPSHTCAT